MRTRRFASVGSSVAGVIAVALVCFLFHTPAIIAALVLLFCVLLAGTYTQLPEAVASSIAATLSLDYFFIPPVRAITVADPQGWIVLLVFIAVALIATNLSSRLRQQRDELAKQQLETEKLYALSRALLLSDREGVRRLIINKCIELFGFGEVALFESSTGAVQRSDASSTISDEDLHQAAIDGSNIRRDEGRIVVVPIALGNKTFGSLGLRGDTMPEATRQALVNTVAVGLAQAEAQESNSRAKAVRLGEELKSLMIDALAHDLKTPLTIIEAAADMLLPPMTLTEEQRTELIGVVRQESRGLKRMMDEAIHLAHIDAKKLKLESKVCEVRALLEASLEALGDRAASHGISIVAEEGVSPVLVDKELAVNAVKQLLDNALKYSPAHSTISVTVHETNGLVTIAVRDEGPGLNELERRRVFEKFYRGRQDSSGVQGTGMGLAIAKEIIEAHGGAISVESLPGHGSQFTITLPAVPQAVPLQEKG